MSHCCPLTPPPCRRRPPRFACIFYLIARLEDFSVESWVGRHYERFDGVGNFGA